MRKGILAIVALSAAITGCSNTSGSDARVSHSGFDNATVVHIDPHGTNCSSMVCIGLGADWDSKEPDLTLLEVVVFNEITAVTGAELNIDGKTYGLKVKAGYLNFSEPGSATKKSRRSFVVPTDLVREVAASKRTWVRVHTTSGYLENAVIDGQSDSKAYHALKRFLAAIDANRPAAR